MLKVKRETIIYILQQSYWSPEDSSDTLEARLNNIRDEAMTLLNLSHELSLDEQIRAII
jgi:hypothetical protein